MSERNATLTDFLKVSQALIMYMFCVFRRICVKVNRIHLSALIFSPHTVNILKQILLNNKFKTNT